MAQALAERDLRLLQESGFSAKQAEGILSVTQSQAENTEKKVVTREYLDLQAENITKSLVIQVGGVVLSGILLLGWFTNYLDNKTHRRFNDFKDNVNVRFDEQNKRFDDQNKRFDEQNKRFEDRFNRFEDRFNRFEDRFNRIESDLKELKEEVRKAIK